MKRSMKRWRSKKDLEHLSPTPTRRLTRASSLSALTAPRRGHDYIVADDGSPQRHPSEEYRPDPPLTRDEARSFGARNARLWNRAAERSTREGHSLLLLAPHLNHEHPRRRGRRARARSDDEIEGDDDDDDDEGLEVRRIVSEDGRGIDMGIAFELYAENCDSDEAKRFCAMLAAQANTIAALRARLAKSQQTALEAEKARAVAEERVAVIKTTLANTESEFDNLRLAHNAAKSVIDDLNTQLGKLEESKKKEEDRLLQVLAKFTDSVHDENQRDAAHRRSFQVRSASERQLLKAARLCDASTQTPKEGFGVAHRSQGRRRLNSLRESGVHSRAARSASDLHQQNGGDGGGGAKDDKSISASDFSSDTEPGGQFSCSGDGGESHVFGA